MNKIHINTYKQYDVVIGRGLINNIEPLIISVCNSNRIAIITDDIVNNLYGDSVFQQLINKKYDVCKFVFQNGEQSKNISTLSNILEFLADNGLKRNDTIIALGGGVVGDIAGLSAALYVRGIKFIQVPTTLLAMVDASIGGKTAIDLKAGKNLAGAFWQPSLVVCDIDIIEKLPQKIFTEGMGEVIKYDVIGNYGICEKIENEELFEDLESIIANCIMLKKQIVEEDELETIGIRKLLNVGHTIAHGIEKMSNFSISHGFAVGTGLVWEAGIAFQKSICDLKTFEIIKKTVIRAGLFVECSYDLTDFVESMKKDKKNTDNHISFMLPNELGKCKEYKIGDNELITLLEKVGEMI